MKLHTPNTWRILADPGGSWASNKAPKRHLWKSLSQCFWIPLALTPPLLPDVHRLGSMINNESMAWHGMEHKTQHEFCGKNLPEIGEGPCTQRAQRAQRARLVRLSVSHKVIQMSKTVQDAGTYNISDHVDRSENTMKIPECIPPPNSEWFWMCSLDLFGGCWTGCWLNSGHILSYCPTRSRFLQVGSYENSAPKIIEMCTYIYIYNYKLYIYVCV